MRREDPVSPYLKRPLRSLETVLGERARRLSLARPSGQAPAADNSIRPRPPAKSA